MIRGTRVMLDADLAALLRREHGRPQPSGRPQRRALAGRLRLPAECRGGRGFGITNCDFKGQSRQPSAFGAAGIPRSREGWKGVDEIDLLLGPATSAQVALKLLVRYWRRPVRVPERRAYVLRPAEILCLTASGDKPNSAKIASALPGSRVKARST